MTGKKKNGLPEGVRRILPSDTAETWLVVAPQLPKTLYLGGGTAVAVHLAHRESRDLDFFFHRTIDLDGLRDRLSRLGDFAVTHESEGTLKGLFNATKVEFLDASEPRRLAKPSVVAGLRIASLQDLMAMKLKVLAERGEMRDYFDVKAIDESGGVSVEEGVELYMARYGVGATSDAVTHLIRAMGDLNDVEVDKSLPISRRALREWWAHRQVEVIKNSSRFS